MAHATTTPSTSPLRRPADRRPRTARTTRRRRPSCRRARRTAGWQSQARDWWGLALPAATVLIAAAELAIKVV